MMILKPHHYWRDIKELLPKKKNKKEKCKISRRDFGLQFAP
jgi:hypothetical protein